MQSFQSQPTKTCIIVPDVYATSGSIPNLEEALGLAKAIDLDVVYHRVVKMREIKSGTYFSKGLTDSLKPIIEEKGIELLIADCALSPIQQRNLEKELSIKVIDRTALILEIFGRRANTKEGSLQVELAHLTYQRSRLVRSWTHLERQRGGAGFLGGPGETQIELDRRLIDDKIVKLKKELEKVKQTRLLQRSARKSVPYPIIALVGYTNAGKSSLFNALSGEKVFVKDLLFATLDTTLRKIRLPSGQEVILSDTVGFISNLPHELVMSFRATLEEVLSADVIVHVRDISNPDSARQKKDVLDVLHQMGLKEIEHKEHYIEVLNKADLLEQKPKSSAKLFTSAVTKEGLEKLLKKISAVLGKHHIETEIDIDAADGKKIDWLYKHAEVLSKRLKNKTMFFKVRISKENFDKFKHP